MREYIRQEWLKYALAVDCPESVFWHLTPKTIQVYFEADKIRQQRFDEFAWLVGFYVKQAVSSTPLTAVAVLAEKLNANKLPKYPEKPVLSEKNSTNDEEKPMTKEEMHAESVRAFEWLKMFGGNTSGVRFNN